MLEITEIIKKQNKMVDKLKFSQWRLKHEEAIILRRKRKYPVVIKVSHPVLFITVFKLVDHLVFSIP